MADNNQNRHVVDSELIKKQSKVLEAYKQATAELEEKLGKENSNHSTEEEVQIKPNEDKNNNLIRDDEENNQNKESATIPKEYDLAEAMKAAEEAVQAAALKNTGASRYTEETHKESSLEIEQPPEPKDTESNLKPDQVQQIENKGMEDSVSLPQQDKKEPMLETKDTAAGIASDGALVEKNAKPRIDAANDELPKTKHHSPISDSPLLSGPPPYNKAGVEALRAAAPKTIMTPHKPQQQQ